MAVLAPIQNVNSTATVQSVLKTMLKTKNIQLPALEIKNKLHNNKSLD